MENVVIVCEVDWGVIGVVFYLPGLKARPCKVKDETGEAGTIVVMMKGYSIRIITLQT